MMRGVTALLTIAISVGLVAAKKDANDDADVRAPVRLVVDGDVIPWRRMKVFAVPGGAVNIRIYKPRPGFIEVTKDNQDERLSPHFRLKQFHVKQQMSEWPKYVIVQTRLLLKLEEVLARVRRSGYHVDTLHVMSAYRTPWYNRAIGNETTYSQHLWGSAADIFVDDDGDGTMDDLNGDKRIDREDATVLMG